MNFIKTARDENDNWLDEVIEECAQWLIVAYKRIMRKKAAPLSDEYKNHIKKILEENGGDLQ